MSRRKLYTVLIACTPWFYVSAQDKKPVVPVQSEGASNSVQSEDDEEMEEDDSEESLSSTKVMVIPFNPSYYDTDVNAEYADAKSNKRIAQAKDWAKFGLEKNVKARIVSGTGKRKDGLDDYSSDSDNDINKIYESVIYQYEKRDNRYAQKNSLISSLLKKLQSSEKAKQAYQSDEKHKEYMNVVITDPQLLPAIAKKYGIELFVFINQYEIYTNYKKVIDPVNKIYQRQIKLHFSIFDATGEQIYGDVAILSFQGVSKDIDEIILNRFPVVANYVSNAVENAPTDGSDTQVKPKDAPATPANQNQDNKEKSTEENDGG